MGGVSEEGGYRAADLGVWRFGQLGSVSDQVFPLREVRAKGGDVPRYQDGMERAAELEELLRGARRDDLETTRPVGGAQDLGTGAGRATRTRPASSRRARSAP